MTASVVVGSHGRPMYRTILFISAYVNTSHAAPLLLCFESQASDIYRTMLLISIPAGSKLAVLLYC